MTTRVLAAIVTTRQSVSDAVKRFAPVASNPDALPDQLSAQKAALAARHLAVAEQLLQELSAQLGHVDPSQRAAALARVTHTAEYGC